MEQINLIQQPSQQDKYAILSECFDLAENEVQHKAAGLEDYMVFYARQTQLLRLQYAPRGTPWPLPVRTHTQLLEVLRLIKVEPLRTRGELRAELRLRCPWSCGTPDRYLDAIVNACLRIWLMINFRPLDEIGVGGGRPCIDWRENETLDSLLRDLFHKSTTNLTLTQRRLNPQFTAACMMDVCGLKIGWTSSLEDHLRLDRQQKVLWVLPHRGYLVQQAESAKTSKIPFPPELFAEASRTLDLLFPPWDRRTRLFLKQECKDFHTMSPGSRELDLKYFSFFRERLLELNEDIYMAPAEDWWQLWRDRRDPQKFWTFWIALIILNLTVVATAASIVQTWATLKSMKHS